MGWRSDAFCSVHPHHTELALFDKLDCIAGLASPGVLTPAGPGLGLDLNMDFLKRNLADGEEWWG
jgi:hypothetical protein